MTLHSKCTRVVTSGNFCQVHDMNVVRSWSNHVDGDFWVLGTVDDGTVLVQLGEFRPCAVSSSSKGSFWGGGGVSLGRLWTRRSVYTCVCVCLCVCV
jgi:hypothetical protein